VPSSAATLGYAQKKWGALSLEKVMKPAIRLAEEGYAITTLQRRQLVWVMGYLSASTSAARLFLKNGVPPGVGEILQQKELAATLRRLAEYGIQDFYDGEIARLICEDMREHGGLITRTDLAGLTLPVEREPLWISYRGYRIATAPPPAGGLQLSLALKVLERIHTNVRDSLSDWYINIAETIYEVFRERERLPIKPGELSDQLQELILGDAHAGELASSILKRRNRSGDSRSFDSAVTCAGDHEPGDTTHLCVTDGDGNVVALTQSIQSLFGAKVANARLGFLYNNYLCTCPRKPHPYQLGSRCSPQSNVAPAIAFKSDFHQDIPFLALGAAGSRRITSSVLQVLSNVIDRELHLQPAVDAPRVHALLSDKVWLENPAASDELLEKLRSRFRRVVIKQARHYKLGAVQGVQLFDNGGAIGAADPRRDGNGVSLPLRASSGASSEIRVNRWSWEGKQ
jgi:gamma-glutamyltranspeptidase/glutathione hydrolase